MLALLLLSLVVSEHGHRIRESRRAGGRAPSASAKAPLCDIVAAGDKSGAWECVKGDGTMAAGSATTFVATGTPTNTTENGFAVRTYTNAQNDQQPADAAFPASDFSICMHHRSSSNAVAQLAAFGPTGAAAAYATLPFEVQGAGGNWVSYTSNGVAGASLASGFSLVTNTWYLLCFTYQRVGGAADNVVRTYVNGTQTATNSTGKLVHAVSSKWTTNGYAGGTTGGAGARRGVFITYKLLSATDIARLYGRLAP